MLAQLKRWSQCEYLEEYRLAELLWHRIRDSRRQSNVTNGFERQWIAGQFSTRNAVIPKVASRGVVDGCCARAVTSERDSSQEE